MDNIIGASSLIGELSRAAQLLSIGTSLIIFVWLPKLHLIAFYIEDMDEAAIGKRLYFIYDSHSFFFKFFNQCRQVFNPVVDHEVFG